MSLPLNRPFTLATLSRHRRWLLLAMLLLLHFALLIDIDDLWSRALLVSHLGVFLLWQPLWRGEEKVSVSGWAFIALACATVLLAPNWWLLALWLGVLFALVSGRVFTFHARWLRLFYLGAMLYLLALLLLWATPHLFAAAALVERLRGFMLYAPLLLLAMALLPVEPDTEAPGQTVDFVYSVLLFLLVVVLVLASFAFMTLAKIDYPQALLRGLFALAAILLLLSWLWNPRIPVTGFAGLQPIFSRYLLNLGTPFEAWLTQLAAIAEHEAEAERFLELAAAQLSALPWVQGVSWQSAQGNGNLGAESGDKIKLQGGEIRFELSARYRLTETLRETLRLHTHLLVQIIGYFYETKRKAQQLRQITRLQTLHETGSRLTHDIKNLLQSLYILTRAGEQALTLEQKENFQNLLGRQLPELTRRLEATLKKLKLPQGAVGSVAAETRPAKLWWLEFRERHANVVFFDRLDDDCTLPASMFDSVADNLIDNAAKKCLTESGLKITATLSTENGRARLRVCDDGQPLPAALARRVLRECVDSENGLGVGLYQAARLAEQHGYALTLQSNQKGAVCFELG